MSTHVSTGFLPPALRWILRILAAAILLQTLFFKFTGAPESIYIFTKVGAEPLGRIGSGVMELICAILLVWPRWSATGALLTLGVISGAIIAHLTILGIVVQDDGGTLFILACIVWVSALLLLLDGRRSLPVVGKLL